MAQVLCNLPSFTSDKLLVGFDSSDDAAVYQLNDSQALIQTLDFFTPIVDDPYLFGQIAAANALSDVYAMGGEPVLAMNIVGFPSCLPPAVLSDIMRGGADKVKEAGALLVGGHSIEDKEPKYGLSVSGLVAPERIWANNAVRDGDVLIMTKPLGIGVLTTALKEALLTPACTQTVIDTMRFLNKYAKEAMATFDVSACTDITGFGLLGHALEMVNGTEFAVKIDHREVPFIEEAKAMAEMGIIPGGAYRNFEHIKDAVRIAPAVEQVYIDLFCDPQTSGGLLVAVAKADAVRALSEMKAHGVKVSAVVGEIVKKTDKHLVVV